MRSSRIVRLAMFAMFVFGGVETWQIVGVGDFNGDGHADVLWFNANTGALGRGIAGRPGITSDGWPSNEITGCRAVNFLVL